MDNSLVSCFELYLKRSDLRPSSIRFKRRALEHFLRWFGDMPVGQVNLAMAEDYKVLLAKDGRKKRTANGYLANFKPFWDWLWRHGLISSNPFFGIRLYRTTELERQTFTARQLSWMLRLASRLWRVRICLGLLGMRRGEVMQLTVREINLSGPQAHILLCPKEKTETTWPWGLKGHACRMVALPEAMKFEDITVYLHQDIVRLQEDLPAGQPYILLEGHYYRKIIGWQRNGKPKGKPFSDEHTEDPTGNMQRFFRQLQENAGVTPTRRFHELRAAFCTKMIPKCGLERAARAAGHSSVETTRKYDRRTQQSLVAEIGRLAVNFYET
jgi:integrase